MRSYACWLIAAACSLPLPAAWAQGRPGPAYFLRHPATAPPHGLGVLPPGPPPAAVPSAAIPTRQAAAGYALLVAQAGQPSQEPAAVKQLPRRYLSGPTYPPYDPYQNLPEAFRKHTLPDVRPEPLPVQLLRSALAR